MKTYLEKLFAPEGEGGAGETPPANTPPANTPPASETPAAPDPNAPPAEPNKPADPNKPAEGEAPAPLTFEGVKFPEGFELNAETAQGALDVLNNKDLSPTEQLQGLVDWYTGQQETTAREWVERSKADGEAIKNDPEIGGANFGASETAFAQLRQEFGSPELDQDLVTTGMGNKLSFAKFLVKLHKSFSEGKPLVGDPTSGEEKTAAQKLYPTQGTV